MGCCYVKHHSSAAGAFEKTSSAAWDNACCVVPCSCTWLEPRPIAATPEVLSVDPQKLLSASSDAAAATALLLLLLLPSLLSLLLSLCQWLFCSCKTSRRTRTRG